MKEACRHPNLLLSSRTNEFISIGLHFGSFTPTAPPPTCAFDLLICHFFSDSFRFKEILEGHVSTFCI
jgi:hypothetical protein